MKLRPVALIMLACALASTDAIAQEEPDEAEVDAATLAFEMNERGFVAFEEGRYAEAARAFADAWAITRDETLRKNEAIAWFRAGECDAAVAAGNKFLLVDGVSAPDRADIHAVIANCKVEFARRSLDAGDLELAETMLDEAEALEADSVARDRIAAARVDLAGARRAAEDARPAPEPEVRTVFVPEPVEPSPPFLGYALLAGGGTALVGATAYHLVAFGWQQQFFRMERGEDAPDSARFESLRKRVHTARVLVPILYTLGVAASGAGVTLVFFVEPEGPTTSGAKGARASITVGGVF